MMPGVTDDMRRTAQGPWRARRRLSLLAGVLALAAVLLGCGDQSASTPPDQPAGYPEDSIEFQLATIDDNVSQVASYDAALDALKRKCTDSRRRLGDMAVNTRQIIKDENGETERTLYTLRQVRRSIPPSFPKRGCADLFVAYATLRTNGFSGER